MVDTEVPAPLDAELWAVRHPSRRGVGPGWDAGNDEHAGLAVGAARP
jgi:hypothetical protein